MRERESETNGKSSKKGKNPDEINGVGSEEVETGERKDEKKGKWSSLVLVLGMAQSLIELKGKSFWK